MLVCGLARAQDTIVVDLPLPPPAAADSVGAAAPDDDLLRAATPRTAAGAEATPPPVSGPPAQPGASAHHDARELLLEVGEGDSLYLLFRRHGLSQADLVTMLRTDRTLGSRLRRLRPGQRLSVTATPQGRIERLTLSLPGPRDLQVRRGDDNRFTWRRLADAQEPAPTPLAPTPEHDTRERPAITPAPLAAAPAAAAAAAPVTDAPTRTTEVAVRRGDSLFLIFQRLDVPAADLALLLEAEDSAASLRRLHPGQRLEIGQSPDGRLRSLRATIDETRTLDARREGDGFRVRVDHVPLERRQQHASAVIENALFLAGQRAGLSDRVIMQLVEIFGWDVDFALDVRAGDRFIVVYEELYKDGAKVRDGSILAAEFVNRGRTLRAVRYTYEDGRTEYFSPDGLSMRKAFLRTPVNFSRISSRFSRGRMHPVLQRMRAHKGVDYAAPTGTPVKAAGNGRVVFSGRKGGYGKTVILQHGATYTTLYGHLSRIHRRARSGNRVQQGEIIGYVGSTGLATGPHLHYEFRVRGVHKDPLRVRLPKALPIATRLRRDFLRVSAPLVATLETLARTSLAASD